MADTNDNDRIGSWDGGWDGPAQPPADEPRSGIPSSDHRGNERAGGASPHEVFDITPQSAVADTTRGGPQRRHLAGVIGTLVVVLALVLGSFGLRQVVGVANSTAAPATRVPASTFAYLQVDLSPSQQQRQALLDLSRQFPDSPTAAKGVTADNVVQTLIQGALKNTPIDYNVDIKPWLGNYAAVAAFDDTHGKPQVVGIVAVKDKGSATTTLTRASRLAHFAFDIGDGYAVIGKTQSVVDAERTQAAKSSLAGNGTFTADLASLSGDQLISGWADLAKVASLAGTSGMSLGNACPMARGTASYSTGNDASTGTDPGMVSAMGMATPPHVIAGCESPLGSLSWLRGLASAHTGRLVIGATAQASALDLQLRVRGGNAPQLTGTVGSWLGTLPDRTGLALGMGDPAGVLQLLQSGLAGAGGAGGWFAFPPLAQGHGAPAGGLPQMMQSATGLTPGDIQTLLGSRAAIAVQRNGSTSLPLVALKSHPTDLAKAKATVRKIGAKLPITLAVEQSGANLVVADSQTYARSIIAGGHLGDSALFKAALGDNVASANAAAFVNLRALGGSDAHSPFRAVGVTVRTDHGDQVIQVRLVG